MSPSVESGEDASVTELNLTQPVLTAVNSLLVPSPFSPPSSLCRCKVEKVPE